MSVNYGRFHSLYNGLTSIAQRVYDAVPISEAWSYQAIHAEMCRLGTNRDLTITRGCLNSLKESGLVCEPTNNMFVREAVRTHEPKIKPTTKEPEMAAQPTLTLKKLAPTESLSDVLTELALRAETLATQLKKLSEDMSNAAVDVESALAESETQLTKYKQLKSLRAEMS